MENPYLSKNLYGICEALLLLETNNPTEVFGKPDDKKLCSSMTLFAIASEGPSIFKKCWKNTFLENMIVGQKEFYRIIN